VGKTTLPPGRDVIIVNQTDSHYRVIVSEMLEGWVEQNTLKLVEQPVVNLKGESEASAQSEPFVPFAHTPQSKSEDGENNQESREDELVESKSSEKNKLSEIKKPGEKVFLGLDYEAQERGGICAGSSLLNIINYKNNKFTLTQEEFFSLFNSGRSGANSREMEWGLSQVGYKPWPIYLKSSGNVKPEEKEEVIKNIISELDSGNPLSITRPGHAFVLVGYDIPKKIFYAWDQSKETISDEIRETIPNAPHGVYGIPMSSITTRYDSINAIYGMYYFEKLKGVGYVCDQIKEEAQFIEGINSSEMKISLFPHEFPRKPGQSDRDYEKIAKRNLPLLLSGLLRNGRQIVIPHTEYGAEKSNMPTQQRVTLIDSSKDGSFNGKEHPEGKIVSLTEKEVMELLLNNAGKGASRYWSFHYN
jgi:hypothetical protein